MDHVFKKIKIIEKRKTIGRIDLLFFTQLVILNCHIFSICLQD